MNDPIVARWAEAERILDEVLDLPDGEQAAAARARCGEDAELAAAVQRLLETTLDVDAAAPAALVAAALADAPAADEPPASIGPFRVLRELGRGGMGRVLLAVRDGLDGAPRMAIKVLDRAMARPDDRRRFDRERETLARLQHPHIARLFDGGVADDGTPYLVMEFVEGAPIDDDCRRRDLDVPGRLALVRQVCDAVEYAHGQLVVHRDLKPANVMVCSTSASPNGSTTSTPRRRSRSPCTGCSRRRTQRRSSSAASRSRPRPTSTSSGCCSICCSRVRGHTASTAPPPMPCNGRCATSTRSRPAARYSRRAGPWPPRSRAESRAISTPSC